MAKTKTLLKIRYGAKTDKGLIRDLNEDHLITREINGRHDIRGIYAVADGMGGHNAGEVASQMVIDAFNGLAHSAPGFASNGYKYALEEILSLANRNVFADAHSDAAKKGMGTTFTGFLVEQNNIHIIHVGDSRAYVLRGGRIQQVTEEHSYVADLLKKGKINKAEVRTHTDANIILKAVGIKDTIQCDSKSLPLLDGDVVLLCTDGLTDLVMDNEIQKVIEQHSDPQKAVDELIRMANLRGGDDNITVILLFIGNKKTVGVKRRIFSQFLLTAGLTFILAALTYFGVQVIKDKFSMVGVPGNMGKVSIESTFPSAVAYINGVWVGKTPVKDVLFDVGTHKLEVQYKGFRPYLKRLTVSSRERTQVTAKFYGTLILQSTPSGARVHINGIALASRTPLSLDLEAGKTHTVLISREGCESRSVTRKFFETVPTETLSITLPELGAIEVESYLTSGAEIWVDNVLRHSVFAKGNALIPNVLAGKHLVEVKTKEGHSEKNIVNVRGGRTSKVLFTFGLKAPGAPSANTTEQSSSEPVLVLKVNVSDFYYSISGSGIDTPPKLVKGNLLRKSGFPAGSYVLIISKDGYEDKETSVTLKEKQPTDVYIELKKQ